MNWLKTAVREHLGRNGFDGLWCDGVPCGCLKDGLAPCDGDSCFLDCAPGYRRDVPADEECGCDGQGQAHWHVEPAKEEGGAG